MSEAQREEEKRRGMPPRTLEVSDDDNWIPCMVCGGEITQERKAFFRCINCGQEYIATEEDMRPK